MLSDNSDRQAFVSFVGDVPVASKHWQDDCFYGSQFLNGCNPDTIKRCTKLPSNFPVTQEMVGNLLDEGDTLEKAMKVSFSTVARNLGPSHCQP